MITSLDMQRITKLLIHRSMVGKLNALEQKLQTSKVVESESAPNDLITMNSEVYFHDLTTNEKLSLRLVYELSPRFGNQATIFAPLGTALLGTKKDDVVTYQTRDGSERLIKITDILYQPEANGQFEL